MVDEVVGQVGVGIFGLLLFAFIHTGRGIDDVSYVVFAIWLVGGDVEAILDISIEHIDWCC